MIGHNNSWSIRTFAFEHCMEHQGFDVARTPRPHAFEAQAATPGWRDDCSIWVDVRLHEVGGDDGDDEGEGWDTGTVVKERPAEPKLKRPPMYKVIMLNDDYTPMEFVVDVLMKFFQMDQEKAWQVMYAVHTTGSAVVGIFPRDIAETKSEQVNAYAQENQFPLRSTVEMTD